MKYAILGAGGMGIQYGVLLQEFAHQQVDFVDTWTENVEKIREQGGAYVSQDGEGMPETRTYGSCSSNSISFPNFLSAPRRISASIRWCSRR